MIVCRTCRRELDNTEFKVNRFRHSGRDADCRSCDRRLVWRLKSLETAARKQPNAEYLVKKSANSIVLFCLRRGWITRPTKCAWCAARRQIVAHHEDYSKPLDVLWICHPCHARLHYGRRHE